MVDVMMNTEQNDQLYPLTVTADRYGGAYSGGAYLAWPLEPSDVPGEPDCGDLTCGSFWDENTMIPVGRGDSPNKAVEDLLRRIKAGESEPDKPRTWYDIMRENVQRMRDKLEEHGSGD